MSQQEQSQQMNQVEAKPETQQKETKKPMDKHLPLNEWIDSMSIPLDSHVVSVMAQLAIPNNYAPITEEDLIAYEKIEARREALAGFCLKHQIQLFPMPESIAIFSKQGVRERLANAGQMVEKQIPKMLLTCWSLFSNTYPVELITGKEENKKGETTYKGTSWEIETGGMLTFSIGGVEQQLHTQTINTTPYSVESHYEVERVYAHEFTTWMLAWSVAQLSKLNPAELAEFAVIMQPSLVVKTNDEGHVGLYLANTGNECFINLSTRDVLLARGQDRLGMKMCAVYGQALPVLPLMVFLAIKIGSKRFNGSIAEEINDLPNMWLRDSNYGHVWEGDHPTRNIVDDLRLPIGAWYRDEKRNALSVWPYAMLKNEDHSLHLAARIKKTEGMATTDKYNMKSVGGKRATLSRGIWMRGNVWKSLHDAGKAAKMQNRPDQARKFQCLFAELVDKDGEVIHTREASKFHTLLDE
jgi:hypothetical protein